MSDCESKYNTGSRLVAIFTLTIWHISGVRIQVLTRVTHTSSFCFPLFLAATSDLCCWHGKSGINSGRLWCHVNTILLSAWAFWYKIQFNPCWYTHAHETWAIKNHLQLIPILHLSWFCFLHHICVHFLWHVQFLHVAVDLWI
jgi:hypothetical protein